MASLTDRIGALESGADMIREELTAINRTGDTRITSLAANIDRRLSVMSERITSIAANIDRNDRRMSDRVGVLAGRIAALEENTVRASVPISWQSELIGVKKDREALEALLRRLQGQLTAAEGDRAKLREQAESLHARLAEVLDERDARDAKLDAVRDALGGFNDDDE